MSGSLLLLLGLGGIFLGVAVLLGTVGALTGERQQVGRLLAAVRSLQGAPRQLQREAEPSFADRVLTPGAARLTRLGRRLAPSGQVDKLRQKLDLAGSPRDWDADKVLAAKALGLIGLGALAFFLPLSLGVGALPLIAITAVGAVIGWFAPDMWLYQRAYDRSDQIRRELADALDLLTISVEAGLGFDAALSQVAKNTTGPLADEFFRVLQEMQIGLSRSDAFRGLAERTDVPDLKNFVTAMVQADSFGIPIGNVLRVQAKELRVKRTQRAEEAAQKVPIKILFPLIFCILPALFVVIIGPAGINIFRTF